MSQDTFIIHRFGMEQGPLQYGDLQMMARSGQIDSKTMVRKEGGQWFPVTEIPGIFSSKDWITAMLLSFFLGYLGVDRFYLGHTGLGVAKLLTFGGCGIWSLIDFILICINNVKDSDGLPLKK